MCDQEDMARVKELSKNITVDYEYVGDLEFKTGLQQYAVWFDFGDLDGSVVATSVYKNYTLYYSGERFMLDSGKYTFNIYYTSCANTKVGAVSVNLRKFNEYSLRDECSGLEDELSVCDSWNQDTITESIFMDAIKTYQNNNNIDVTSFISRYYIYFIIGGILIVCVIILLVIRNIKRNRLD